MDLIRFFKKNMCSINIGIYLPKGQNCVPEAAMVSTILSECSLKTKKIVKNIPAALS